MVAHRIPRGWSREWLELSPQLRIERFAPPHSRKFATNEAMVGKVAIGLASSAPKPV